jgi:hypothetical protein
MLVQSVGGKTTLVLTGAGRNAAAPPPPASATAPAPAAGGPKPENRPRARPWLLIAGGGGLLLFSLLACCGGGGFWAYRAATGGATTRGADGGDIWEGAEFHEMARRDPPLFREKYEGKRVTVRGRVVETFCVPGLPTSKARIETAGSSYCVVASLRPPTAAGPKRAGTSR